MNRQRMEEWAPVVIVELPRQCGWAVTVGYGRIIRSFVVGELWKAQEQAMQALAARQTEWRRFYEIRRLSGAHDLFQGDDDGRYRKKKLAEGSSPQGDLLAEIPDQSPFMDELLEITEMTEISDDDTSPTD